MDILNTCVQKKRIIVGMTGASGELFALHLLKYLSAREDIEVHLIASEWAVQNLEKVDGLGRDAVYSLADYVYDCHDMSAPAASGSFCHDGMVIVPCSMKTLSAVANGYCDNLITRAADVTIKEGRQLLLAPRETPFSAIHLENMLKLARIGVVIMPPVPGLYSGETSLGEMADVFAGRVLARIGIQNDLFHQWEGYDA